MINAQDVVHETLDGEVVVVNLRNGRYYSLMDTACEIWTHLVEGLQAAAIEAEIRKKYSDPSETLTATLSEFLKELASEGLLVPQTFALEPNRQPSETSWPPFRPPVLNKHVDMESLLLIDPIHDVADQGWPTVKATN